MALIFITHDLGVVTEVADDVGRDVARPRGQAGAGGGTVTRYACTKMPPDAVPKLGAMAETDLLATEMDDGVPSLPKSW